MSLAAVADTFNTPNYVGELFLIGANQTPFLNMVGGLNGGYPVGSWEFPIAQPYSLDAAAQPAVTEAGSQTAPDPKTYARSQDSNVCQIFHRAVNVSYAKQSAGAYISGVPINQAPAVDDELAFQISVHMKQIAKDADYTFLNGAYAKATKNDEAYKTRGIITACSTNTLAASDAALDKAHIDTLLRTMATNGAQFGDMVIFCNALQKQRLTSIYAYAPQDRNVGGVDIKQIETDFAMLGIVWAPNVPADTILVADLSVINPVALPVPGKGILFYEELSKTGAAEKGQIYGQLGIDYGPEEFHGTITGLKTT